MVVESSAYGLVQLRRQRLVSVQGARLNDQPLGEIGVDAPIAMLRLDREWSWQSRPLFPARNRARRKRALMHAQEERRRH